MKAFILCAGLLLTVAANAALIARAPLTGQHVNRSPAGTALLICEYSSSQARFEILSQNGKCAPFITVQ